MGLFDKAGLEAAAFGKAPRASMESDYDDRSSTGHFY